MEPLDKQDDANLDSLNPYDTSAAVTASSSYLPDANSESFGTSSDLDPAPDNSAHGEEEDGFMCHLGVFRRG